MKVKDLIKVLSEHDGDDVVFLSFQSGDHWRTELAKEIHEVSELTIVHSAYHGMDEVCKDQENPPKGSREVLILC